MRDIICMSLLVLCGGALGILTTAWVLKTELIMPCEADLLRSQNCKIIAVPREEGE